MPNKPLKDELIDVYGIDQDTGEMRFFGTGADGSFGFQLNPEGQPSIIKMEDGLPQLNSINMGASSLKLGQNVELSVAGDHFLTEFRNRTTRHLYAHNEFATGGSGTDRSTILRLYNPQVREITQSDNTGSFTGTEFTYTLSITEYQMLSKFYFQTDTTGATQPVCIDVFEGTDDTGSLLWRKDFPASHFPASSEIEIEIDGFLEYTPGSDIFVRLVSLASVSVKTDIGGTDPWRAIDYYNVDQDVLLVIKEYTDGATYTIGDWIIDHDTKKIYSCNVTGVQTGTFASNIAKWDVLTSGNVASRSHTTGILEGGILSLDTSTTIDWTSGKGVISDKSDPEAIIDTDVSWIAVTGYTPTNIATDGISLIGYDSSGVLTEKLGTAIAFSDSVDYIWMGAITHMGGVITEVIPTPANLAYNGPTSFFNFANFVIGPANVGGNIYGANGANLNINVIGGPAFILGSNFRIDTKVPDIVTLASESALSFYKVYREADPSLSIGYDGAQTTSIDPTKYDDGSGTLATVTAGYWTIQRIFRNRAGSTFVAYGQQEFVSLSAALAALGSETFQEKNPLPFDLFRCSLVVSEAATDLSDTAEAEFFAQSSFRSGGAISSSSTIPGITSPGGSDTDIQFNEGGVFGGTSNITYSGTSLDFSDNIVISIGSGGDFQIEHDGSNTIMGNTTGALTIENSNVTGEIINKLGTATTATQFSIVDSADGVLLTVDGSGIVNVPDDGVLSIGTGGDLTIAHDTIDTKITAVNGDMTFIIGQSDKDMEFHLGSTDANSAIVILDGDTNIMFTFTAAGIANYRDDVILALGDGRDLELYHDSVGSQSYIVSKTNNLIIDNQNASGNTVFELGSDTSASNLIIQNLSNEAIATFTGDRNVLLEDNVGLIFGDGQDCTITHNGTNTVISTTSGDLIFDVAGPGAVKTDGPFTVDGKLTVTGLIDPTGLVLTEQASVPDTPVAGFGYVWTKNTTPSTLVFTDDAGTDHLIEASQGDVTGPASSILHSMSRFADTTGKLLESIGAARIEVTSTDTNIVLSPQLADGGGQIIFENSSLVQEAVIDYDSGDNLLLLSSDVGGIEYYANNGSHVFEASSGSSINTIHINSPSVTGTAKLLLNDSTGSDVFSLNYIENSDLIMIATNKNMLLNNTVGSGTFTFNHGVTGQTLFSTTGPNTNPPISFESSGSNGTVAELYLSTVKPQGVITSATAGDLCIYSEEDDPRLYISGTGGATNNDWYYSPTVYDGATKIIKLQAGVAGATGYNHYDSSGNVVAFSQVSESTGDYVIEKGPIGTAGNFAINAADGHLSLNCTGDTVRVRRLTADDTLPILTIDNLTANCNVFVTDATPQGAITAKPGSVCYLEDDASSRMFMHLGTASTNSDWAPMVMGVSTSTDSAIPTFSGTSGVLQDNSNFLYQDDGSDNTLFIDVPSALGTSNIVFDDFAGSPKGLIQLTDAGSFLVSSSGVLDLTATGDMNLSFSGADLNILPGTDFFSEMSLHSGAAGSSIALSFKDSVGTDKGHLLYSGGADSLTWLCFADSFIINSDSNTFLISTSAADIDITPAAAKSVVISTGGPTIGNALLKLDNSNATNGGETAFYVSGITPIGNITGDPGQIATLESGSSSAVYIHKGASSDNTSWSAVGDVIGPASSTNLSVAYFDGTTGKLIKGNVGFVFNDANGRVGIGDSTPNSPLHVYENTAAESNTGGVTIEQDGTGDALLQFLLTGGQRFVTGIDNTDDSYKIAQTSNLSTNTRMQIQPNGMVRFIGGDILFDMLEAASIFEIRGSLHSDTDPIFRIDPRSTNGDIFEQYVGDRDPTGNVSALPGSQSNRIDGIDSNIFLNAGSASGSAAWYSIAFPKVYTSTATESIGVDEDYIRIDATAAIRVLTLPDASTVPIGKDYKFKLVAKGTGFYGEITPFAGDSIDGSTSTRRLATVGDVFTLRRVGVTSWDIVQSAREAHAEMYMTGTSFQQLNITTTAIAVTAWTNNGDDAQGIITADQTNNKFIINHVEDTVNGDHYRITANLSYEFNSSALLELSVYVGGVVTNLRTITKGLGFSSDQLNTTVTGDFTTTSTGDVEVRIASVSGTNDAEWWTGHVDLVRT